MQQRTLVPHLKIYFLLPKFSVYHQLNHWMVALSKGFYINFVSVVLQKVAAGHINEVATLMKIKSMRWYGKYVWTFLTYPQ